MRRFLFAVAALLLATSSHAFGGYIIVRVLLEGGGAPAGGMGEMGSGPGPMPIGPRPGPMGFGSGPGPMGIGPMFGAPGAGGAAGPTEIDHTRSVAIVVPLETDFKESKLFPLKQKNDQTNPEFRRLSATYHGRTLKSLLFVDSSRIQLYQELIGTPGAKKTRATEMREAYSNWQRSKNETQQLWRAMEIAVNNGFIRETVLGKDGNPQPDAMKIAQDLLDAAAEKRPLPAEAEAFVKAWGPMAKAVRAPASERGVADDWRAKLDTSNTLNLRVDGHYAVLYWDTPEPDVARRCAQLNDNFYGFYLAHAMRGVVVPVPTKPFVVVLPPLAKKFNEFRSALDGLPSQNDAFYAPEHDLLVLAPELMDAVGLTFQRQNQQVFVKGFNRDKLLAGEIPQIENKPGIGPVPNPEDVARANTLAFVEKFVVEDSEVAAISREGSRQLLYATGGLPRHVTLPNWLTQGALNYHTRPRGPAYVTVGDDQKPMMAVTFNTGYDVPNYVLHRYFKEMGDSHHKELNPVQVKLLENVLTDAYFTGLKDAIDPDPPSPIVKKKPAAPAGAVGMAPMGMGEGPLRPMGPMGPGPIGIGMVPVAGDEEDPLSLTRKKRERLNIKSQATAWALYYYLARARSAELREYVAELNKLPRDLPIDGRTSYAAFVRAFKLSAGTDATPDPDRMKQFAKAWLDYIEAEPGRWHDIQLFIPEPPKTGPMGPMGPMAPMGGRPPG